MATDTLTRSVLDGDAARPNVYRNFIDGEWVASVSGDLFENRNPANSDDLIGVFQKSTHTDVEQAIDAARLAFERWRLVPAPRRAELLFRAAQLIAEITGASVAKGIVDNDPEPKPLRMVRDYVKAYETKYNSSDPPDYHVAESTAACLAFEKAIENAGSLDPSKVRDALASLDVMTFFGQIKFDSRGINTFKPMVVEQIQSGVHYTVFPADVANGKPQYPTPPWSSR